MGFVTETQSYTVSKTVTKTVTGSDGSTSTETETITEVKTRTVTKFKEDVQEKLQAIVEAEPNSPQMEEALEALEKTIEAFAESGLASPQMIEVMQHNLHLLQTAQPGTASFEQAALNLEVLTHTMAAAFAAAGADLSVGQLQERFDQLMNAGLLQNITPEQAAQLGAAVTTPHMSNVMMAIADGLGEGLNTQRFLAASQTYARLTAQGAIRPGVSAEDVARQVIEQMVANDPGLGAALGHRPDRFSSGSFNARLLHFDGSILSNAPSNNLVLDEGFGIASGNEVDGGLSTQGVSQLNLIAGSEYEAFLADPSAQNYDALVEAVAIGRYESLEQTLIQQLDQLSSVEAVVAFAQGPGAEAYALSQFLEDAETLLAIPGSSAIHLFAGGIFDGMSAEEILSLSGEARQAAIAELQQHPANGPGASVLRLLQSGVTDLNTAQQTAGLRLAQLEAEHPGLVALLQSRTDFRDTLMPSPGGYEFEGGLPGMTADAREAMMHQLSTVTAVGDLLAELTEALAQTQSALERLREGVGFESLGLIAADVEAMISRDVAFFDGMDPNSDPQIAAYQNALQSAQQLMDNAQWNQNVWDMTMLATGAVAAVAGLAALVGGFFTGGATWVLGAAAISSLFGAAASGIEISNLVEQYRDAQLNVEGYAALNGEQPPSALSWGLAIAGGVASVADLAALAALPRAFQFAARAEALREIGRILGASADASQVDDVLRMLERSDDLTAINNFGRVLEQAELTGDSARLTALLSSPLSAPHELIELLADLSPQELSQVLVLADEAINSGALAEQLQRLVALRAQGVDLSAFLSQVDQAGLSLGDVLRADEPLLALTRTSGPASWPAAGPNATAQHLPPTVPGYTELHVGPQQQAFLDGMGAAIDAATAAIRSHDGAFAADDVWDIYDDIAGNRAAIAEAAGDSGAPLFRLDASEGLPPVDIIAADPNHRHYAYYQRAAAIDPADPLIGGGQFRGNTENVIQINGETVPLSTFYEVDGDFFVQHPPFITMAGDGVFDVQNGLRQAELVQEYAFELYARVLNDSTMGIDEALETIAEANFLLYNYTPNVRGTPAVVGALNDAVLRERFGVTFPPLREGVEPFWEAIFAGAEGMDDWVSNFASFYEPIPGGLD